MTLPVIAPEGQEAVREMNSTFHERYSPAAIAARVAAIEHKAAQVRVSLGSAVVGLRPERRGGYDVPRGFIRPRVSSS